MVNSVLQRAAKAKLCDVRMASWSEPLCPEGVASLAVVCGHVEHSEIDELFQDLQLAFCELEPRTSLNLPFLHFKVHVLGCFGVAPIPHRHASAQSTALRTSDTDAQLLVGHLPVGRFHGQTISSGDGRGVPLEELFAVEVIARSDHVLELDWALFGSDIRLKLRFFNRHEHRVDVFFAVLRQLAPIHQLFEMLLLLKELLLASLFLISARLLLARGLLSQHGRFFLDRAQLQTHLLQRCQFRLAVIRVAVKTLGMAVLISVCIAVCFLSRLGNGSLDLAKR